MTKCFKCCGTDIVKGTITRSSKEYFSDVVFRPDGLRFLALTLMNGVTLDYESYACLGCGAVWSETDPNSLIKFMKRHCKQGNDHQHL